jgi:hypothetical protein
VGYTQRGKLDSRFGANEAWQRERDCEKQKLAVDKKKEKEEKKAAKAEKETKDFEEELKQADEVKLAFLKRIQNQGMDVWKQVSYFELKKLYIAKERKKPEQKIQQKDLITMMKEAYKDDYNIGSLDE